jgi:hypothetical protein
MGCKACFAPIPTIRQGKPCTPDSEATEALDSTALIRGVVTQPAPDRYYSITHPDTKAKPYWNAAYPAAGLCQFPFSHKDSHSIHSLSLILLFYAFTIIFFTVK